jgi:CheY-like chemotaxis protein
MTKLGTVLIVDDEPANVEYVVRCLRQDFVCITATSGTEAVKLLAAQPVDLVISDMRMPGMTGTEVLAHARAINPKAGRLILSAYSDPRDLVPAINDGGAQRYVAKPVSPADLRRIVRELLDATRRKPTPRPAAPSHTAASSSRPPSGDGDPSQVRHLLEVHVARAHRFRAPIAMAALRAPAGATSIAAAVQPEPGVECIWERLSDRDFVVVCIGGASEAAVTTVDRIRAHPEVVRSVAIDAGLDRRAQIGDALARFAAGDARERGPSR